jgi:hypothetical protein
VLLLQALFPDERAVNFYISWRRDDKSAQSYLAYRANFLDESEIELMAGVSVTLFYSIFAFVDMLFGYDSY